VVVAVEAEVLVEVLVEVVAEVLAEVLVEVGVGYLASINFESKYLEPMSLYSYVN
jgi:hypothetical protein